jgi:hypothetical protein
MSNLRTKTAPHGAGDTPPVQKPRPPAPEAPYKFEDWAAI